VSRYPLLAASAAVILLTLFLTWPQALHLGTRVYSHADPYFSMWRLEWIAHALSVDPHRLYDANIFHPEPRVLAYSDATLMQGAIATPLFWAGLSPVLVYNLLLLGGIAASGIAMFVLVRYLTNNIGSALVSAAIFTLAPYRIEHYMHLELQWTMWIPLAFWAAHRAFHERSWRMGALAGVMVWFQLLSCVYYGVFLGMMLALLTLLLAVATPRHAAVGLAALGLGGAIAVILTIPYAMPYLDNARLLGPRDSEEVARYSARLLSYATTPWQNWIWGWTADRFDGDELHLAPGVVPVALALVALFGGRRRWVWTYVALCAAAVELSLGANGHLYPSLRFYVAPLGGLRALARCSILAVGALAVLAGLGVDALQRRFSSQRAREWVCATAIILITLECGSAPIELAAVPTRPPDVYRVIGRLERRVMVELPMAKPQWMPGYDPFYQYFSIFHWNPLVNGYSGYVSSKYVETLTRMLTFPDRESMARLHALDVRYVLVHEALFDTPSQFAGLMLETTRWPQLKPVGRYKDWVGNTYIFELH
jgi:hypothetical protein